MIRTLLITLTFTAVACGDTAITLRRSAIVNARGPVRLRDIAQVLGDDATVLGERIIAEHATGSVIGIDDVRTALRGVNWGHTTLSGSRCELRIVEDRPAEAAQAVAAEDPLTALVRARVALDAGIEPDEARVEIEGAEGLADMLAGRTVELRPLGRGDRIPIRVMLYEGDRIIDSRTIRVRPSFRTRVAAATRDLCRGDVVGEGDVEQVERWVPPREAPEVGEDPVGATLKADVAKGEVIGAKLVERDPVVRRGDIIAVDMLSGSFKVEVRVRARADAAIGEVIEFETLHPDRREKRVLSARVSGPGRGVRVAGGGA